MVKNITPNKIFKQLKYNKINIKFLQVNFINK